MISASSSTMPVPLEELVGYCRDDIAHYQRFGSSISAYPLVLFARAVQGDQAAWTSILELYSPLVRYWVSCFASEVWLSSELDSLTNAAFARFAHAFTPAKLADFPSAAAILKYLKLCVYTAVCDERRSRQTHPPEVSLEATAYELVMDDPASEIISHLSAQELWQVIQEELVSEEERWLFFLAIIQDLKPREICALQPHRFPTVDALLQKKRSLLQRLARNHRIRDLLAETPQKRPVCKQDATEKRPILSPTAFVEDVQPADQRPGAFTGPDEAEKEQKRSQAQRSRPKRKESPSSHTPLHSQRSGQDRHLTYYQQVTRCGKQTCGKCRDGIGHGPYWYAYRYEGKRIITTYIGKTLPGSEEAPTAVELKPHQLDQEITPGQPLSRPKSETRYHLQRTLCGKDRCRKCCDGIGHGPYWYAYRCEHGKSIRSYVGKTLPAGVTADDSGVNAWMNE